MNAQTKHYQDKLAFEIDSADLYDALNEGVAIVVLDARKPFAYAEEHIPLAQNFPHRDMDAESTRRLDRSVLYVTYCDGIGCNASTKGALKLAELGFQVKELIGGIDWWKRDGYETAGAKGRTGVKLTCAC